MASKLQTETIKKYEHDGWLVINLIAASKSGFADLICFKDGHRPLFIEIKEKGDTIKPLQQYRAKQVRRYGCDHKFIKE